jgi:hypothetical protein
MSFTSDFSDVFGRGYRDSLIWVSVLQHATTKISECVLITKNSKDFAAGKDEKSSVHPDLLDDWQKAGKTAEIRLCATLSEFVNSFVKPTLQRLDNLKRDLAKGKTLNIQEYLMEHFQAVFEGVNSKLQLDNDEVLLEQPFGVTDLGDPKEIKLRDVLGLEGDRVYIEFTAEFDATAFAYVFKSEAVGIRQDSDFSVSDWGWNEHYAEVEGSVTLETVFGLTFERKSKKVVSFEVKSARNQEKL